jgi:hypothetical protein
MTDSRLRELERRALTDPEAETALLRERMRIGDLSRERTRLAGFLGADRLASIDLGPTKLPVPEKSEDVGTFDYWTKCLSTLGVGLDGLPKLETRCSKCSGRGDEHYIERGRGRMGHYYDGPKECSGCESTGKVWQPWSGDAWVLRRASLVASQLAVEAICKERCPLYHPMDGHDACVLPRKSIKADRRHLEEGTDEALTAWVNAWNALDPRDQGWIAAPGEGKRSLINVMSLLKTCAWMLRAECKNCGGDGEWHGYGCDTCGVCDGTGSIPDEDAMRAAIREDLVPWLLA